MQSPLSYLRGLGLAAALLLFFLPGCGDRSANAASEQQDLVDHATSTVQILKREENFREPVNSLLSRARGVLIYPSLFKAGFILGAAGRLRRAAGARPGRQLGAARLLCAGLGLDPGLPDPARRPRK